MPERSASRAQGSSTRIVNGQVVVRRNLVQKLFHLIYVFFRAIYFFFKTLVVPLSTLETQKRGSGNARTHALTCARTHALTCAHTDCPLIGDMCAYASTCMNSCTPVTLLPHVVCVHAFLEMH